MVEAIKQTTKDSQEIIMRNVPEMTDSQIKEELASLAKVAITRGAPLYNVVDWPRKQALEREQHNRFCQAETADLPTMSG